MHGLQVLLLIHELLHSYLQLLYLDGQELLQHFHFASLGGQLSRLNINQRKLLLDALDPLAQLRFVMNQESAYFEQKLLHLCSSFNILETF